MKSLTELSIDPDRFHRLLELAKEEDLGDRGDITTQMSSLGGRRRAELRCRTAGVVAGLEVAPHILGHFDNSLRFEPSEVTGGDRAQAGTVLGMLEGSVSGVLLCERTLLNFLQRLSGIATLTRRYVDAVSGTPARIYDTRKTVPGWRDLEKYAVRCGGGHNHRRGLYDAILLKDNHFVGIDPQRWAYGTFEMLSRAANLSPPPDFTEVEVDTLEQLAELLKVVGLDVVLLDNFSVEDLRRAVQMRDELVPRSTIALEASGGVTLDTVRAMAETGVERISVGSLTHSAVALDIALDMLPE